MLRNILMFMLIHLIQMPLRVLEQNIWLNFNTEYSFYILRDNLELFLIINKNEWKQRETGIFAHNPFAIFKTFFSIYVDNFLVKI